MITLIKNGWVLDPATKRQGKYDVLVEDDCIKAVEPCITTDAHQVIDADGKYVMPGFIDLHVHLREPGFEYKETIRTGSMAAAAGGFTTICAMPNTKPVMDTAEKVKEFLHKVEEESLVNVIPIGAITTGQQGVLLSDLKGMAEAGVLAVSEDGKSVMNVNLLLQGMVEAKRNRLAVFSHCEEKDLVKDGCINDGEKSREFGFSGISNSVEDIITARDIFLARDAGVSLHLCHCSTEGAVALVKMAKEMNIAVTAEVCPHHFILSDDEIKEDDANWKMNPPLRSRKDVHTLKLALRDGIIDAIATDHAPHSEEEKSQSIRTAPFGIVGLETAFSLTMTELVTQGYLTPYQMVEKMSYIPARILGIEKGSLAPGSIADLVIADPQVSYQIDKNKFASKGKNTPFHGRKVVGKIELTMVNGETVFDCR